MANGFDAYHKWLSIPPQDQPPNHYRLLGLGLFESDPDVVAAAADRQMAHVQTYKTGPHSDLSQKLLNEISAAKLCLLRPQKKAAYDEQLRQQLAAVPLGAPPFGWQPTGTPPAGIPAIGAARLSNPAAYAGVGSDATPGRASATTGAVAAGTPYPGFSNAPVAPPPPALPPPVAVAPQRPIIGTTAILIGAGVVAVALLIGIIMVLNHRNDHAPSSTVHEKTDTDTTIESPNVPPVSPPAVQPVAVQPVTPKNPTPTKVSNVPGPATPFQSGFQATVDHGTKDHGTKPKSAPGVEVATTGSPAKNPDKTNPLNPNSTKPNPGPAPPIKPATDPSLAGKAAVPDKASIAATEQRLGILADVSAADVLEQAHKAAEAAEIYVLLRHAIDTAVKQGDAATAISAADELARRFAVNSLEVRSQTLNDLQARPLTSDALAAVAEAAAGLIDDAMAAGQPDLAQHLAEMSLVLARRSANIETIRKITLRIVRMRNPAPAAVIPGP